MRYIDLYVLCSDIKPKKELDYNKVPITSGSVNDLACRFEFSSDWDVFPEKTAVFAGSGKSIAVLIKDNTAVIPWEVLAEPGYELFVGVSGVTENDETIRRLNTEMASLGIIAQGADTSASSLSNAPTPDISAQYLTLIEDIINSENSRVQAELQRESKIKYVLDNIISFNARLTSAENSIDGRYKTLYNLIMERTS